MVRRQKGQTLPKKDEIRTNEQCDGVAPDPVIASSSNNIPKALEFKKKLMRHFAIARATSCVP
jgi:hypothetical protein